MGSGAAESARSAPVAESKGPVATEANGAAESAHSAPVAVEAGANGAAESAHSAPVAVEAEAKEVAEANGAEETEAKGAEEAEPMAIYMKGKLFLGRELGGKCPIIKVTRRVIWVL